MDAAPSNNPQIAAEPKSLHIGNGFSNGALTDGSDHESDSDDSDSNEVHDQSVIEDTRVALACDDGCVRLYRISDIYEFIYNKSLPRVSGRVLSVTWSSDASRIFSGTSEWFIRCWDAYHLNAYHPRKSVVGRGCQRDEEKSNNKASSSNRFAVLNAKILLIHGVAGHLPTGLKGLDDALFGRIPFGVLTELVGPAGIGKTQFCSKLSLLASLPVTYRGLDGGVIFIDMESKFSSRR